MKKIYSLCCMMLTGTFLAPGFSFALIHISNNNLAWECGSCHIYGGPHYGSRPCEDCHYNASGGGYTDFNTIEEATHSSAVIGSNTYGTWEQECLDCHQHHTHKGLSRYDGVTEPSYVLGEITVNWPVSNAERTKTTFTIDASNTLDPAWGDPATWAQKTGNERGLILVMKPNSRYIWWEVVEATTTTVTIANVRTYFRYRDKPFEAKLVYGMLIQDEVNGVDVDAGGPYTMAHDESETGTDPTPDGICQVCHTLTQYWRSDGSLADHYNGEACTDCHTHIEGFKPNCNSCHGNPPVVDTLGGPDGLVDTPESTGSTSSGAHVLHAVEYGYSCETCHKDGMPVTPIVDDYKIQMGFDVFDFNGTASVYYSQTLNPAYDYQATNGTNIDPAGIPGIPTSCENMYCHSNGTAAATRLFDPATFPGPSQTSPAWNGSTDCASCHTYGPNYDNIFPKKNAHVLHLDILHNTGNDNACHVCHKNTTVDGLTTIPEYHVNGQIDVAPDGDYIWKMSTNPANWLPVAFDFYPDPGGSSGCSNISCHNVAGLGDKPWGYGSVSASPHTMKSGDVCGEVEFGIGVSGAFPLHYVQAPVTFYIDWGDGESFQETYSTNQIPGYPAAFNSPIYSHIYDDASIDYEVTWSVRDANLLAMNPHSSDKTKTHTVTPFSGNVYPTAAFTVSVDGYTVTLTDQSFDPDYNTCGHEGSGSVTIDWGPGGFETYELNLTDTPSGQQFVHTYSASPDTHGIQYGVYDNVITYPVYIYDSVTVPQN